jgi:hypothetical protein
MRCAAVHARLAPVGTRTRRTTSVWAVTCFVYVLTELVSRMPVLQIDSNGVTDRSSLATAGRLSWDDVGAFHLYTVAGQRMLAIVLGARTA